MQEKLASARCCVALWLRVHSGTIHFMTYRFVRCALVLGLCISVQRSGAEETNTTETLAALKKLSMEELMQVEVPTVYGASKHEQSVTEAPSDVSIVTKDDIKKYGYRTLADVVQSARGVFVTGDGNYSHIGMWGFNRPGDLGGRVLITIDGHRVNEPLYDHSFSGTDGLIDVDLIERVEVIRGPGSSLYGNNAFFGVINVVTRKGRDLNGTELSGAAATFDTYTGRVSYGKKFANGVELLVSGTGLDSEGNNRLYYPEFKSIDGGVANDLDGTRGKSAFATVTYRDFTLQADYAERRKDTPTAAFYTVFDYPGNFTRDERGYLDLKYQHECENDLVVMARVYYDHYRYDADYPADYYDTGYVTINRDFGQSESLGQEIQLSKPLFEDNLLTGGVEYRHDLSLQQHNFDVSPPATYLDVNNSADTVGLYLQDEYKVLTNLVFNVGARYDYYNSFGDTVNPRAAVIYTPVPKSTFKFIYGQAYRAPNAYELYFAAPGYHSNPDLKPEKIRSYDLVYEQGLAKPYRVTTSLFYNQISSLIELQQDPSGDFFGNREAVDSRGVETELAADWANGLRGRVSYTLQDAVDKDTGETLSDSPQNLAKLNLTAPLYRDKVFAGLEFRGMSSRQTVRGNETGAYWIANATLFSRELFRGLELSASLYNLFDRKFEDPVSLDFRQDTIEQPGRSFRVKLTYRF